MKKKSMTHTMGLKILFGPKYWLWHFEENKLSFVTPYILSKQMSCFAHYLYSTVYKLGETDQPLFLWDMFGGIGTDSVYLSKYFNVVATENNPNVFKLFSRNIREFNIGNINLIETNCLDGINRIKPDIIYYDPPWGETYRSKVKNFDFNQVYIDYPFDDDNLPELQKHINCMDLLIYLYNNVTPNIIIKSPLNSNTFEKAFPNRIQYIYKYPNKNLKFIYLVKEIVDLHTPTRFK